MSRPMLALFATTLLCMPACDTDDALLDDDAIASRIAAQPPMRRYHGRWEGEITQVDGITNYDYDATVVNTPGSLCTVSGVDHFTAEWDYFHLGVVCTSDLSYLGTGTAVGGSRYWTFYDENKSGSCVDGYVDFTETADPTVMHYTWRYLDGTIDAEGEVEKNGLCTPGF